MMFTGTTITAAMMVSRIAAKSSRADGLAAALGMGAGGLIFATLALMGLVAVLLQVEQLYIALRVLGDAVDGIELRAWSGPLTLVALVGFVAVLSRRPRT